jgi:vacuolar protein sorting-associated protein 45
MPDRLADKERSEALAQMHLIKILRAYMLHMVGEVPGYKALVLDKDTMRISSTQFGRTELAEHNVVHIERLDSNDSKEHLELKASNSRSSAARHSAAQQQLQQQNL